MVLFCMIRYKFLAASPGLIQDPRGVNYVISLPILESLTAKQAAE